MFFLSIMMLYFLINTFCFFTSLYYPFCLNKSKPSNLLKHTEFNSKKYLHSFFMYLFSPFDLYSFKYTDLSNHLLKSSDSFWLSFADKKTTEAYNFVSDSKNIIIRISINIFITNHRLNTMLCAFKFQFNFAINQCHVEYLEK